jgi:hypothetical protein
MSLRHGKHQAADVMSWIFQIGDELDGRKERHGQWHKIEYCRQSHRGRRNEHFVELEE